MAQSVALHPAPVEHELELDPESNHYYGFDQSSASALASQHSDTLGASASDPPSDLGPPGPPAAGFAAPEQKSLTSNTGTGHDYQQQQQHQEEDYGYETESDYVRHYDDEPQHEEDHHHHQQNQEQSQQPLESTSWHAGSQLPPEHEAHQGQGQQSPQPYRPESGPVHASATTSPPLQHQPASVHNPRSNRSYSVAASLASVGSQSSIRRKPLSPTASPLAVRFSSKLNGNHMPLYDLQHPDSGYYSLDSPDLYDLSPNKQEHAPASISAPVSVPVPAVAAANNPSPPGQTPSLSPPLVEESDEDE